MSFAVMGIDPGVKGGLAVLSELGTPLFVRPFTPGMTRAGLVDLIKVAGHRLESEGGIHCFLEKVGYIGKRPGKKGDGGKGSFTFGRVVGLLEGAIISNGLTIQDVPPMLWQAKLECLSGGNKNVTKARAIQLFPKERITHAIADALLIAEYGRRRLLAVY